MVYRFYNVETDPLGTVDQYRSFENASKADWTDTGTGQTTDQSWNGSNSYYHTSAVGTEYDNMNSGSGVTSLVMFGYCRVPQLTQADKDAYIYLESAPNSGLGAGAPAGPSLYVDITEVYGSNAKLTIYFIDSDVDPGDYGDPSKYTLYVAAIDLGVKYFQGSTHWFGLKVKFTTTSIDVYIDLNGSGNWSSAIYSWNGTHNSPAYVDVHYQAETDNGNIYIDYVGIDEGADGEVSPDYFPTSSWFVRRLSEIGHGYMIIPDQDVDFSNYYDLQEQGIVIYDDNGVKIFHGMITTPHAETDGIRLDFKEITEQLVDRKCKRDYTAEKGTVTETGTVV